MRASKPICSPMKRPSVSASMRRSSVCWKFMAWSSQAQDHLGDDVLLDLVGAAEDRQLAVVEVLGRGVQRLGLRTGRPRLVFFDKGQRARGRGGGPPRAARLPDH